MKNICLIITFLFTTLAQAKPLEIVFWHSMAGSLGEEVNKVVDGFNNSQGQFTIKAVYKGEYSETLTSFAAAFRAHQAPGMVQVFEVGTATMLMPAGIIKPVDELMRQYPYPFAKEDFLPAIRSFYSEGGELQAMPFNLSIPVMFYNADALAKIGINKDNLPRTWGQLATVIGKLQKNGQVCGYTTAYPSWILIESFSSLQGLPLTNGKQHAVYNNQALVHHLQRLQGWQQKHFFEYGGRASNATLLFTSGRCAFFSQSSGSYNGLAKAVNFRLGLMPMPLDEVVGQQRAANVAGGAAIWVSAGQQEEAYRGIAEFFSYLAQPAVQQQWFNNTGYLPLGLQGRYAAIAKNQPLLELAEQELNGARLNHFEGPQNLIRTINDETLEAIFAQTTTPKKGLDSAVRRADHILGRFACNTQGSSP